MDLINYKCIIDFMGIQETFEFKTNSKINDILPQVLKRFNFNNPVISDFYFITNNSHSRLSNDFILNESTTLLFLHKIRSNILLELFPKLEERAGSISTPLVNDIYKSAKLYEKQFECIENIVPSTPGDSIWSNTINGTLPYDSYGDIYFYVRLVISDIITACDIKATCINELVFTGGLKPEYLVITNEKRLPIGFVLVKKPDDETLMDNDKLHGEMLHHLLEIREMYGQKEGLFGIVSTYNKWRIYWLHNSDHCASLKNITKRDQIKSLEIEHPNTIPTKANTLLHSHDIFSCNDCYNYNGYSSYNNNNNIPHYLSELDYNNNIHHSNNNNHQDKHQLNHFVVHGSKVYDISSKELPNVLISAILKMYYSKRTKHVRLLHPDRLYIEMTKDSWSWVKINIEKLNYVIDFPLDKIKSVIILKDLKGGAHGKVWLCCTENGNVFVLKFSIEQNSVNARESLLKECAMWQTCWDLKAHVGFFSGKWALLLPFVLPADENDWKNNDFINQTIRSISTLANKSIYHKDLEKRHVGKYYDNNSSLRVIFFDLAFCEVNHNSNLIKKKMMEKLLGPTSPRLSNQPQQQSQDLLYSY